MNTPMNECAILRFAGQYRFLSNFAYSDVLYGEEWYNTVEHAYQAAKTNDKEEQKSIRNALSPGDAKSLGQKATLIPEWEEVKFDIMLNLLRKKFTNTELGDQLAMTCNHILVEGNSRHDNTWGVCYCSKCNGWGRNHLGRLLMKVREELR